MIRILFLSVFTLISSSVFSYEISLEYRGLEKELVVRCEYGESFCEQICYRYDECRYPEGICKNCLGRDVYLYDFFENIGRTYINTMTKDEDYLVTDFFTSREIVTIDSQSYFNIFFSYNSKKFLAKLQKVCPNSNPDKILFFFEKGDDDRLGNPRYITCDGQSLTKFIYSTEVSTN